MNYFIKIQSINKAKNDIEKIVQGMGFHSLTPMKKRNNMLARLTTKIFGVVHILTKLKQGDILLLQYPMKKFYKIACTFAHIKGAKVVTVIHDLGAFRRHKLTPKQENKLLSQTDFLIVHNEKMKEHLFHYGYQSQLYCLNIFDYLSEGKPAKYHSPHHLWSVVYAGGLGKWRNEFLYKLDPYIHNWSLDIYGKGFEKEYADGWKNIVYQGFLSSEKFIAQIEADFGLVWDGDSINECSGDWGEYLKINNPHKTSFYLRSGLPVIVWKEAAMASFIHKHKIGICINSLAEIDDILGRLTEDQYQEMKKNAMQMGEMLNEGYFIKQALSSAIQSLKGKIEVSDHKKEG